MSDTAQNGQQTRPQAIPVTHHDLLHCEACGAVSPQELIQAHAAICEKAKGFVVFYLATPMQVADWLDRIAIIEFRMHGIGDSLCTKGESK